MRKTLERFQPAGAWADVRYFFGRLGQPHQLLFLLLALVVTGVTIWGFYHDSKFEKAYKRDIVYVQQWRLDRTDAQIVAQQKIDGPEQLKRIAEQQKREEERRQSFKRVDDKLKRWGL